MRKFADDIYSGKINNIKSAVDRYLEDILQDQKFLNIRNIVKERTIKKGSKKGTKEITPSYTLKRIFEDLQYAVFGSLDPDKRKESEKLDIAMGGEDIGDPPPVEDEEDTEKKPKKFKD